MLSVQKDIGLVGIDQTQSIVLSRLVDISHDVTAAESQRLVAEAKLITMQSAPPDVLATLSGDPVLLSLKERMTSLQAEYASLNAKYGDKNPRLLDLRSEMAEVARGHEAGTRHGHFPSPGRGECGQTKPGRPAAQIGPGKKLGLHGQLQSGRILARPPGIRIQSIVVRRTATATARGGHHRRPALNKYPQDRPCGCSGLPQLPAQVGQPDARAALRPGHRLAVVVHGGSSGYKHQNHL